MSNRQHVSTLPGSPFGVAAGRAMLGALFVVSGLLKIGRFAGVAASLAAFGMPISQGVAGLVIVLEVGIGLALVFGWRVRIAAMILVPFVVMATLMFHPFWAVDAAAYGNQLNHFLKNIALLGALLMVACTDSPRQTARLDRPHSQLTKAA